MTPKQEVFSFTFLAQQAPGTEHGHFFTSRPAGRIRVTHEPGGHFSFWLNSRKVKRARLEQALASGR